MNPDPPSDSARLIGRRVGHIRILSLLGKGGMGEVYAGSDETLQRRVAVKAIRSERRLAKHSRARFLREARVLSQLEHPNICRIYDYIQGEGSDFLVLELIEGDVLGKTTVEKLTVPQRLGVAIQIAAVLEAAHGKGIVHRDLKPHNVMLSLDGEAKVLDFGLARSEDPRARNAGGMEPGESARSQPDHLAPALLVDSSDHTRSQPTSEPATADEAELLHTRHGQLVGTLSYMSPEQAQGEALTTASDMYSYGLLLQALFTGQDPYPQGLDSATLLERARKGETLPAAGVDPDLGRLIERLKLLAPAARPTAVEALARLRWIQEKPRRRRRGFLLAAAVALIALATAKYTFDLKTARDEAESRRTQAEGLIGFMIGDLRDKLSPVNRLEVLDDIGDQALEYFQALPAAKLSDDELLFRSRTLSQIGQVRMDQGNLPAALTAFEQALALADDLVRREPDRDPWRAELGAAHFWVGSVFWSRGQLDEALESFRRYLAQSEKLVASEPANLDWQLELSYAHNNVGSILEAQGNVPAAIEAFRTSLGLKERLVAEEPTNADWRVELAGTHSWLAEALTARAELDQALHHFRANHGILESLVEGEPENTRLRWLLGLAHDKVGRSLLEKGLAEEARTHFARSLAVHQELVEQDPANTTWARDLALSHWRLGTHDLAVGDYPSARQRMQRSRTIVEGLLLLDESNVDWWELLGHAHVGLAKADLGMGSLEAAGGEAREAVRVSDTVGRKDPGGPTAGQLRCEAHLVLGEAQSRAGRPEEATSSFVRALETVTPLARLSDHPAHREAWARALLRLGRAEEARPLVGRLQREGFRGAELVRLSRDKGVWPDPQVSEGVTQ